MIVKFQNFELPFCPINLEKIESSSFTSFATYKKLSDTKIFSPLDT